MDEHPVPHVIGHVNHSPDGEPGHARIAWKTEDADRGLDANVVVIGPGGSIAASVNGAIDILWIILEGSGTLATDDGPLPLEPGQIVRIPPHSRRALEAGPHGLTYFTVHERKPGMQIGEIRNDVR